MFRGGSSVMLVGVVVVLVWALNCWYPTTDTATARAMIAIRMISPLNLFLLPLLDIKRTYSVDEEPIINADYAMSESASVTASSPAVVACIGMFSLSSPALLRASRRS